jgi:uncharacterized membrane protein (UPF0127 family)
MNFARLFFLLFALSQCRQNALLPTSPLEAALRPPPTVNITLIGPNQSRSLLVWTACSAQEQAKGLMHHHELIGVDGMLFAFDDEAPRTFWMHNTPLALDMLFFDRHGALLNIVHNAEPMTDTPRQSAAPAAFVLEVMGGMVRRWQMSGALRLTLPPAVCLQRHAP